MKIALGTKTFDPSGAIVFDCDVATSDIENIERRVQRTRLLSGGVYLNDSGYSPGDRTLRIKVDPAPADVLETLDYLIKNYSELTVVTPDGAYLGVIKQKYVTGSVLTANVYLTGAA